MTPTDLARIRSAAASPYLRPHDSDVLALLGCYEEARVVLRALVAAGPWTRLDRCHWCEADDEDHAPDCLWPRIVAAAGDREPDGVSVGFPVG